MIADNNTNESYMVIKIVESYNFERDLTQKEKKALIKVLQQNPLFNNSNIYRLMQNFKKIGLHEQEIYGTIINLGVNGIVLEETGYACSDLCLNRNQACKTIERYKDKIEKAVSSITILTALSKSLNQQQEEELKEELIGLGMSREFIELKDTRNLYIAKIAVEDYNFGRELTPKEKRALIQLILSPSSLDKKKGGYITKLMQRLKQIGLEEQEIYGTIINLGVMGKLSEESGYGYTDLLDNQKNVCHSIGEHTDKIPKRVASTTILIALSRSFDEQEEQELKNGLEELGINRAFIEEKDIRNVYMAKAIVERYNFGIDITPREKGALIKSILSISHLNKKTGTHIDRLMQRLEQIGLNEQEVYGAIINLGARGRVLHKISGFSYATLLRNQNNSHQEIVRYRKSMQTEVTRDIVERAIRKPEKIIRRATKKIKDTGAIIHGQVDTRRKVEMLAEREKLQELESGQDENQEISVP